MSLRLERFLCTMADADERERNGLLYFKNLRKQQKRRRVERKREQNETCNQNYDDLVKNCTVEKAAKMEIHQIPEPPAKKSRQVEDENHEDAEAECSGIQASKALQLVGNCTATTVEQRKWKKHETKKGKARDSKLRKVRGFSWKLIWRAFNPWERQLVQELLKCANLPNRRYGWW